METRSYLLEVFDPVGVRFSPDVLLELVLSSPSFFEKSFLKGSVFTCEDEINYQRFTKAHATNNVLELQYLNPFISNGLNCQNKI